MFYQKYSLFFVALFCFIIISLISVLKNNIGCSKQKLWSITLNIRYYSFS